MRRLKQPTEVGAQLRMLPATEMPREALAPLEKDLVDAIRAALHTLGYKTWSGRQKVFGRGDKGEFRSVDDERLKLPPFIPVLGAGTPDILGLMADRSGQLFVLECKRASGDKERAAQLRWAEDARYWGVLVSTVRSVREAVSFLEAHRVDRAERK